MKLVKGLKTTGRKNSVATALSEAVKSTTSPEKTKATRSAVSAKPVIIEAKIDVGFGNMIYLRGEGQGLSWSQGIPLTCVNGSTWKWSAEVTDKVKFKLLLNDKVWSQGEDLVAAPGQKVEVAPAF
jgi:hypothetical protein